jgi:hypothetical protein
MGAIREGAFGIPQSETSFERRGFSVTDDDARRHLETAGKAFVDGYNTALRSVDQFDIQRSLSEIELEFQGFAFEGAAMSMALMDCLTPWKRDRLSTFLKGPASPHIYMAHVGAGWAYARLHLSVERRFDRFDPLLKWLAVDGYGFHQGFFHWRRYIERQVVPSDLSRYARRVFDQGLGRSLWFVKSASVLSIAAAVNAFPEERRADLWSGVALACSYAGGVARHVVGNLVKAARPFADHLAQGAAFAAKARIRAGNLTPHTDIACRTICGMSAASAARVTDLALLDLLPDGGLPAYEVWRQRIRSIYAEEVQEHEKNTRAVAQ